MLSSEQQKVILLLQGGDESQLENIYNKNEEKRSGDSQNPIIGQSDNQKGSRLSLSNNSKNMKQSDSQSNFHNLFLEETINQVMINDMRKTKQRKNQKLNFSDMFFKIKFKSMARRLLNSTRSFMFKNLNIKQFKLIDDKSSSFDKESLKISTKAQNVLIKAGLIQNNVGMKKTITLSRNSKKEKPREAFHFLKYVMCSFLQGLIKSYDRKFPVINPISLNKIIWDCINIILILIYTIQIPLYITFPENKNQSFNQYMIYFVPVYLFIDLVYTLNTGTYQKGVLIKKRLTLINLYLKSRIIPTLFAIFSFLVYIFIITYTEYEVTRIYRWCDFLLFPIFLKLSDIGYIVNKLEENQTLSKKLRNIIALMKLIFKIVYIGHFIACIWAIIAQFEDFYGYQTWAKYPVWNQSSWYQLYIDAYYFTTVTMITVGYGDIIPVTGIEKAICIIIMIISCGVFAYSMNTVGAILESFNEDSVKLKHNMQIINYYMERKNVGKLTRDQIREYLYYYWKEEKERDQEGEEKIINILSDNLKKNLLMESKNVVLKKSPIFRNNFSEEIKEKIVPLIKEYRCYPEEVICLEGLLDDCSIYFIEKGSVEIYIENKETSQQNVKSISSIGKGQSFGETSFFTGEARRASVRSREFTTLLILNRAEFLQVLVNHQEDYEKFCAIKDSLIFCENYQLINVECLSCKSQGHQILQCPYLHYTPNFTFLKQSFMRSPNQEQRKLYIRKILKSNSVLNSHVVTQKAIEYDNNNSNSSDSIEFQYLCQFYEELMQKQEEFEDDIQRVKSKNEGKSNLELSPMVQISEKSEKTDQSDSSDSEVSSNSVQVKKLSSQKEINNKTSEDEDSEFQKGKQQFLESPLQINENGNYPLQLDLANKKRGQNYLLDTGQDSPIKARKGSRFGSILEKQNTSDSIERSNNKKKNTFLSNLSNNTNEKKSTFISNQFIRTETLNSSNSSNSKKKKTVIVNQLPVVRQQTKRITALLPQKNQENFMKFIQRGNQNDDENIPKQPRRFDRRKSIRILDNNNKAFLNILNIPSFHLAGSGTLDQKRRFSKLNSNDVKMLNNQFNYSNNKQEIMLVSSQTPVDQDDNCDENNYFEENFDCMHNFNFYFPLNNISQQIKLMQMSQAERKQIMFRAMYDNLSCMKQFNSATQNSIRQRNLSIVYTGRNNTKLISQTNIAIDLEAKDKQNKIIERRKSKFFTNQKTLMVQQLNKRTSQTSEKLDKIGKNNEVNKEFNSSCQSISSINKNLTYKFSISKKQTEYFKDNSLQHKLTTCTVIDNHQNQEQGTLIHLQNKDRDSDQQIPHNQKQFLIEDNEENSKALKNIRGQIKEHSQQKSSYEINLKDQNYVDEGESGDHIRTSFNNKKNENQQNNDIFQTNSIFVDQNNTFITQDNHNMTNNLSISQQRFKNQDQQQITFFENSFQEYNQNNSRIKEQDLDDIASDFEQSKHSIKHTNIYVTQKKYQQKI
ncbi:cation channel family protein (macronuclear) [Tetrahymena thermophila SB210]|uniref:Cation channel family protein n=1 Tax=Tetrahymena thermophila (strain SB210) TaxID=312017 RepID=Q23K39_TETTS|nr:cation channel family protein [Tetrahymena thermophila SB210]EAR97004.2 cation channel family protein [Tetrahymena thermophila SB210]|eukprot:XP_001017249.2 cation channel family protein [Tetrahymena thermophila SB210]